MRHPLRPLCRAFILTASLLYIGCAKSPMAPSVPLLKVSAISPAMGSTTGGTLVTVTGAEFASDATLTVGGVAATNVIVQGSTTITAVLGARPAAGASDVVVSSAGKSASLTNGFTFFAPTGTNQPPVVSSIRSIGARPNQPSGFADLDESVTLIPTMSNAESGVTLSFAWSGPGTFTPSTDGSTTWRLPSSAPQSPSSMTATLIVTESFAEGSVTHTQASSPAALTMQVHNSKQEVLDMGEDFLTLFSQSNIPTAQVLHNFSTTCDSGAGRADEQSDVDKNRRDYVQNFSAFRITRREPFSVSFRGACFTSDGRVQPKTDGCSSFAVHWEATKKSNGLLEITNGVDYVSAVVENNEWKLCHSSFVGTQSYPALGITRAVSW